MVVAQTMSISVSSNVHELPGQQNEEHTCPSKLDHSIDGDSISPRSLKQTLLKFSSEKPIEAIKNTTKISTNEATSPGINNQLVSSSPKSLKQTKILSDADFKKPEKGRRRKYHKKAQVETVRHGSVDVLATPVKSQTRRNATSLSPRKPVHYSTSTTCEKETKPKTQLQTQLTSFGIRRTARQLAKDVERQRESDYLLALRENIERGMKIIQTENKGRGVIATRTFYTGEFIVEYAGDLISDKLAKEREAKYKLDPEIGSYMFFFAHAGQKYCVDATEETGRLGRLINHSRLNPNCVMRIVPLDDVPKLALFAHKTIFPGDELLYDYGDRDKESLEAHPWLKT